MTVGIVFPVYQPRNIFNVFDEDLHTTQSVLRSINTLCTPTEKQRTYMIRPKYRSAIGEDGSVMIEIEMAGVGKKDIEIELDEKNGILTVTGKRFKEEEKTRVNMEKEEERSEKDKHENDEEREDKSDKNEETKTRNPSFIYRWKGKVSFGTEMEDIEAKHLGEGILKLVVRVHKKREPQRIQIQD